MAWRAIRVRGFSRPPTSRSWAGSPLLKFMGGETGRHGLMYSDCNTPTSRRKPFGAHALRLFMAISDYGSPPTRDPSRSRYVGEFGRNPIIVNHEFADAGKTTTYFGHWVGTRNEHGPWSLPITAIVMFAGSPSQPNHSPKTHDEHEQHDADGEGLRLAA